MRIATKLTLLLLLSVAVVMAGFGYIRARQERRRDDECSQDEEHQEEPVTHARVP